MLTIATPSNYTAQIVQLGKPVPHSNADRLEGFIINGNRVWYSKDLLHEGDIVIYFPIECQINPQILSNLNLFSDKTLNKDNTKSGYFGHQGRVKAVKLRGEPSEGFIMTIDDFITGIARICSGPDEYAYYSIMLRNGRGIGQQFDTFNDKWVCRKYVPAETRHTGKGPRSSVKYTLAEKFPFHYNTAKFAENLRYFNDTKHDIVITKKMHGASAVYSNLLVKRKLKFLEKLAKFFGIPVQQYAYKNVYSSRNVIKYVQDFHQTESQGYYNADIWGTIYSKLPQLPEGITIYGEIVGYVSHEKMIQKGYDYGCAPGECKFYVYRITHLDQDGVLHEYTWNQIKEFCNIFQLERVPELYYGTIEEYLDRYAEQYSEGKTNQDNDLLYTLKKHYLEKQCTMCTNKVADEGIVIRNESTMTPAYKLKSFMFLFAETQNLDNNEVDIEESN